jgi:hypothetical protein
MVINHHYRFLHKEAKMIKVKNIELFITYLTALNRIVPACEFNINGDGCVVNSIDENGNIRLFLHTDSITSDSIISFCISDIQKLLTSVKFIHKNNSAGEIAIKFTGNYITYAGCINFKIKTIKREVIEKYVTNPIKSDIDDEYSVCIKSENYKDLIGLVGISSSETPKVYMYKQNNMIMGEIDDKKLDISDSIAIPLSDNFEGDWINSICVKVEAFRIFNLLGSNEIKISMTNKNVVRVVSSIEADGYTLESVIYCNMMKV